MSVELKDVSFSYDKKHNVIDGINVSIKAGESVGVIGANGVGKSTFLRLLVGLVEGYKGDIVVNGEAVQKKNYEKIRRSTGFVFQDSDSQLFLSTVYEDVAFGPRNYGLSAEEVHNNVMEALENVGIAELKDRQIYKMSGGQKKLASIATILSMKPSLILFDEPSIMLDPRNRRKLINIFNELTAAKIVASHDLDFILDTCERTILLVDGKIKFDGSTKNIMKNRELLESSGLELPLSYQRVSI